MIKHNQNGTVGVTGLLLVFTVLLLIAALAFGGWAFSSRQSYKNDVDSKIAVAVGLAKQQQTRADTASFAEAAKNPLKTYQGPEADGSIIVQYPKTWSGYVDTTGSGGSGATFAAYFNPDVVPSISDSNSAFALQIQLIDQPYDQTVKSVSQSGGQTPPTVVAYALPKLPKVVGVQVTGSLPNQQTGTMVILPLRGSTLEIWTDGNQYLSDFNNNILPNLTFSP